jgi:hypothetical protein
LEKNSFKMKKISQIHTTKVSKNSSISFIGKKKPKKKIVGKKKRQFVTSNLKVKYIIYYVCKFWNLHRDNMNIFFSIVIFDKARQYLIHATRKCHENHNDILTCFPKCYNEIFVVKSIQKSTFEFYFCVSKVCFYLTNK